LAEAVSEEVGSGLFLASLSLPPDGTCLREIPLPHDPFQCLFELISLSRICALLAIISSTVGKDEMGVVEEIVD
jgi:hypothetical protein